MDNAILNTLPDPIILVNRQREVVDANQAAEDLLGKHYRGRELAASLRHPDVLQYREQFQVHLISLGQEGYLNLSMVILVNLK